MRMKASAILIVLCIACAVHAQKIAPSSGKAMCAALTPADFVKVGVDVSHLGSQNADSPENVYCTYQGKAQKVEFDIFYPAGQTVDEAKNAQRASIGDIGGKFESVHLNGTDEAHSNAAHPYQGSASIVVRKGTTVFDINIPAGPNAEHQLESLAQTVLSRMK